jgi:MbtH protein
VTANDEEDSAIYTVVVNHEEQYSIWPVHKAIPPGWRSAGKEGRKAVCLRYIDEVWSDMRPLSLRREREAGSRGNDPS